MDGPQHRSRHVGANVRAQITLFNDWYDCVVAFRPRYPVVAGWEDDYAGLRVMVLVSPFTWILIYSVMERSPR